MNQIEIAAVGVGFEQKSSSPCLLLVGCGRVCDVCRSSHASTIVFFLVTVNQYKGWKRAAPLPHSSSTQTCENVAVAVAVQTVCFIYITCRCRLRRYNNSTTHWDIPRTHNGTCKPKRNIEYNIMAIRYVCPSAQYLENGVFRWSRLCYGSCIHRISFFFSRTIRRYDDSVVHIATFKDLIHLL